jgi:hypothetical protein
MAAKMNLKFRATIDILDIASLRFHEPLTLDPDSTSVRSFLEAKKISSETVMYKTGATEFRVIWLEYKFNFDDCNTYAIGIHVRHAPFQWSNFPKSAKDFEFFCSSNKFIFKISEIDMYTTCYKISDRVNFIFEDRNTHEKKADYELTFIEIFR